MINYLLKYYPTMLLRKEYIDDDVLLGIREMSNNRNSLINMLPEGQRDAILEQISEMKSETRIIEWLNTRVLLYELLGKEKIISNHPSGRPFLIDKSYKISISHTRGYVAILLSRSRPVGIDIETISERVSKVSEKFISNKEYIDPSNKVVHQLLHWSAKETLFKILKMGEVDFKEHLHILPFNPQKEGVFEAREYKTNMQKSYIIHYEVLDDAVLTWAVDK